MCLAECSITSYVGFEREVWDLMRANSGRATKAVWATLMVSLMASHVAIGASSREQIIEVVRQIQRADYEGDREALKRLHGTPAPYVSDKELASRVQYWRAFALVAIETIAKLH